MRVAVDARSSAAFLRRTRSLIGSAALSACLGAALTTPAHAGLFDDDEARKAVISLRTQAEQNQQANAARQAELQEQIATLKRSMLDLNNQIESLRSDQAKLRGQSEQGTQTVQDLARDVAEFQRKQKDALAAFDERVRKLEPQRLSVDGRESVVEVDEKKAFDDALGLMRKGDFAAAVAAFQAFGRRYPGSAYLGQAKYWTASAQYGKGDLKEASATFKSFIAANPDSTRVPDAMLGLANCQAELKDVKGARKTLEDLIRLYPQSEAGKAGRDRLATLK